MAKFKNFKINWKYTIGEFLIVVFGIVAAFQLDTCKERKFNNDLYVEYLKDLDKGLQNDSIYFGYSDNYFKDINRKIDSTNKALSQTINVLNNYQKKSIVDFKSWYSAYISNSVFEELNNSGRLNLIKNKTLRHDLISYYQYIDFIKIQENTITQSLSRMKEQLLSELNFQYKDSLVIPETKAFMVQNFLEQKRSYIEGYFGHRVTCHQISLNLRAQIKEELEIYQ